ncbi:MAG TPA: hypothetical protein VHI10_16365 [Mycobacterium sp.]|nr:hypothetical protein [Mycobacterium sp.]
MTGPEDSHSGTRPISVAELLAKNGTIGAPPVGGRRRRRRGDTDAISVAELTGEIPIVGGPDVVEDADDHEPETARTRIVVPDERADTTGPVSTNGAVEHDVDHDEAPSVDEPVAEYDAEDDDYADAVTDYSTHVEHREADADVDFFAPPRRSSYAPRRFRAAGVGAEQMSPDPLDDEDALDSPADPAEPTDVDDDEKDRDELPSYLRSTGGPLFGGETVADDLARRGRQSGPEDVDVETGRDRAEEAHEADAAPPSAMSSFLHGALVVGQCMLAVAFGAGLFIAFDQLWKWNNIVALVLSVLVILGLVVGVRVVRKTEDIGSTLIAVAVGALVTLGPLALLQSG